MKTYTEADVLQSLKNKVGKGKDQASQNQVARDLGISVGYMSDLMNGKRSILSLADKLGFKVITTTIIVKKKTEQSK